MGHVRDLPERKLGVEVKENFKPDYLILPKKRKRVAELKKMAKEAKKIILATDPDREGEAIAYHVAVLVLGERAVEVAPRTRGSPRLKSQQEPETTRSEIARFASRIEGVARLIRIVFHEITASAVKEALEQPRGIDMKLVDAQQARRVLDRLVGYKLSPLLWTKIGKKWLSAGRVQSVTVRLIVEREREREKFKSEEYWRINGRFQKEKVKEEIEAELVAENGERYETSETLNLFDGQYQVTKTTIQNAGQAEEIISQFKDRPFKVSSLDQKEVKRTPGPPFTTSTLQQEANLRLNFSSKKTMSLAQRLYEKGLITYHRTDSTFLAEKFLNAAAQYIKKVYGEKYALDKPRRFKTRSKLAQEAHEAIRPTKLVKFEIRNSKFQKGLTRDYVRLYDLIFKKAVASQAKEAIVETTKLGIVSVNKYLFEARGQVIKFDGFLKILDKGPADKILPKLKVGDKLKLLEATPFQHFTKPPPRYNEASLIKTLERSGIGRPSTYAPILSTILARYYIEKVEGRFAPTPLGNTVNDFLVKHFPQIIDIPFTANMEDDLDEIAKGEKKWVPVVAEFYKPFEEQLKKVYLTSKKVKLPDEKTGEKCPQCGSDLVVKIGKYGKFLACSAFPDCKYTAPFLEKTGITCPECGSELIIKKTKRGKSFYGCSTYPKCQFASWKKPRGKKEKLA